MPIGKRTALINSPSREPSKLPVRNLCAGRLPAVLRRTMSRPWL